MKQLLLLRHAKSSWKDSELEDHERPLSKRGKKDAPRVGRLLREQDLMPDLIIASTAKRCRRTADHVIAASGYRGEARITGELYEAGADRLRHYLTGLDDRFGRVLLVAHNPGMEAFLEQLLGEYLSLPTAALAQLELPIASWRDLAGQTRAALVHLWQPGQMHS